MKKRIDTFWRYRNLLFELVKKGIVSEEDIEKAMNAVHDGFGLGA